MKRTIIKILVITVITLLFTTLVLLFFPTWTSRIKEKNSISVLEQVKINGTEHEIMIRGNNKTNPIILFVHGGPGCSEIPYVVKYQDLLEKDFTIFHYDQRASGKSYHFFEEYSNISTDLLVDDLLAMTDYVLNRFDTKKVILVGHSFGTYLAIQAAQKAPEKYIAYIGIGQMSDFKESEIDGLNYCIQQAELNKNSEDLKYLQKVTDEIKSGKGFTPRNLVRKYGGAARLIDDNADYTTGFWLGSEYNLLDMIRFKRGLANTQGILLKQVMALPLPEFVTKLETPFYFVMGQYDYMTSVKAAKNYFDKIESNKKEFIIYENSAHYPQFEEKEKFANWMKETFIMY